MTNDEILERCLPVPGWTYPAELLWLCGQARSCRYIVEIGVYHGRSTLALALATPGTVIGIDSWEGGPDERDEWHPDFATPEGRDAAYLAAWRNLREQPVMLLRADSSRAWQALERGIELLFIDGGHDYQSVKRDILNYRPLVAAGGLICGHDYGSFPGVREAVDEVFSNVRRGPGSTWYIPTETCP
jgi:hypothetical protein